MFGSSSDSDLREYCPPIRYQIASDCVAHWMVGAVQSTAAVDGKTLPELSPLFGYANSRILNGQVYDGKLFDNGTNCRAMLKGISSQTVRDKWGVSTGLGIVLEADYPEVAAAINNIPPDDLYRKGSSTTIASYSRITEGTEAIAGLQAALLRKRFPSVCFEVDESFGNLAGGVYMGPDGSKMLGGHCMMVVGYSSAANAFLIRNSWGTDWGQDGYGWVSQMFIANHAYGLWVIEVLTS